MRYPYKELKYYQSVAYDYYESFLERFAPYDALDLVSVSFCDDGVEFVVIMSSGEHIVNGTSISSFLEWVESVCLEVVE